MMTPFHAQIMVENTVNEEENLNSQSSQLEEEDLQKLEALFMNALHGAEDANVENAPWVARIIQLKRKESLR